MAGFDGVKVRRVRDDEEESFLDFGGKATLFDEEDAVQDEDLDDEDREALQADDDEEEVDGEDDEVDELAF